MPSNLRQNVAARGYITRPLVLMHFFQSHRLLLPLGYVSAYISSQILTKYIRWQQKCFRFCLFASFPTLSKQNQQVKPVNIEKGHMTSLDLDLWFYSIPLGYVSMLTYLHRFWWNTIGGNKNVFDFVCFFHFLLFQSKNQQIKPMKISEKET